MPSVYRQKMDLPGKVEQDAKAKASNPRRPAKAVVAALGLVFAQLLIGGGFLPLIPFSSHEPAPPLPPPEHNPLRVVSLEKFVEDLLYTWDMGRNRVKDIERIQSDIEIFDERGLRDSKETAVRALRANTNALRERQQSVVSQLEGIVSYYHDDPFATKTMLKQKRLEMLAGSKPYAVDALSLVLRFIESSPKEGDPENRSIDSFIRASFPSV